MPSICTTGDVLLDLGLSSSATTEEQAIVANAIVRAEGAVGIVYIAKNIVNGKAYIGQSWKSLDYRKRLHENKARCGSSDCPIFYRAIRKYGAANFEWNVLASGSKIQADLDAAEAELIAQYWTRSPLGYNARQGGRGGKHSNETRIQMSQSHKGKRFTEEHKQRLSEANKGKRPSDATIQAHIVAHKGKTFEQRFGERRALEIKERMRRMSLGKQHSTATKQKMATAAKKRWAAIPKELRGRQHTEETKARIRESLRRTFSRRRELKAQMSFMAEIT